MIFFWNPTAGYRTELVFTLESEKLPMKTMEQCEKAKKVFLTKAREASGSGKSEKEGNTPFRSAATNKYKIFCMPVPPA